MRCIRLQLQETFNRRSGSFFGPGLEDLAHEHQRDDGSAGLKIDVLVQSEDHHRGAREIRHAGSETDQYVHICGPASERIPGSFVKTCADPELHGGGQQKLNPGRQELMGVGKKHQDHLDEKWKTQCQ